MTKLCKDCKWCVNMNKQPYDERRDDGSMFCRAPQNMRLDATSGESYPYREYCFVQRQVGNSIRSWFLSLCGYKGRWWTPRDVPIIDLDEHKRKVREALLYRKSS